MLAVDCSSTMTLPRHVYQPTKPTPWASPPTAGETLFEDTSFTAPPMNSQGFYTPGYTPGLTGTPQGGAGGIDRMFADPVSNAGVMYASSLANQGKDMVNKEIDRLMAVNKLKYFFDVDTKYVINKVGLLMFPYVHQEWEVGYHRDTPLTPRNDANAPDLYIPTMAFVTHILLAGVSLGLQNRFSPEVLGLCLSTALAWLSIEVFVMRLSLYLLTVLSDLSTFDLIAYSGYKYVGMIFAMLGGLLFGSAGYYLALLWSSVALMVFIANSLKMKILCGISSDSARTGAKHRFRHYIIVGMALFQPLIIYWLTSHLVR